MNIIITGFMGAGKTSVGRLLAHVLGIEFVDTDFIIEAETGMEIADIFSSYGEKYFRSLEQEIISRVVKDDFQVIAVGGGAVLSEENRYLLDKNGVIFYLDISPETAYKRASHRPLIKNDVKKARSLYNQRISIYKNFADFVLDGELDREIIVNNIIAQIDPKICISVANITDFYSIISDKTMRKPDFIELRLDLIEKTLNLPERPDKFGWKAIIKRLKNSTDIPIIITHRQDVSACEIAIECDVAFVDIDIDNPYYRQLISYKKTHKKNTEIIASKHFYSAEITPDRATLEKTYEYMKKSGDICKIVINRAEEKDIANILYIIKKSNRERVPTVCFAMGDDGKYTRYLSALKGGFCIYTYWKMPIAPGQPSFEEACNYFKKMGVN